MKYSNSRRRLMAATAAMGVGTLAGLRGAKAQEVQPAEQVVPCVESSYLGNVQNGLSNYAARADTADFAFLAPMTAQGDGITLFGEAITGGAAKQSYATFKGRVRREGDGLRLETMEIQAPLTAFEADGQFYGIVGMAYDQNVPVGLALLSGGNSIAEILLVQGVFDQSSQIVGLDSPTAVVAHDALLGATDFRVVLAVGGTIYSEIVPIPGSYRKFLDAVLRPAMDTARQKDAEAPCLYSAGADPYEDCFLTSACCTVIGLKDRCWELETLRRFRDGWLGSFAAGRADIARYYSEAPLVAQRLVGSPGGRRQLLALYWRYILPSAVLAKLGANRSAHRLYRRMMLDLLERPAG